MFFTLLVPSLKLIFEACKSRLCIENSQLSGSPIWRKRRCFADRELESAVLSYEESCHSFRRINSFNNISPLQINNNLSTPRNLNCKVPSLSGLQHNFSIGIQPKPMLIGQLGSDVMKDQPMTSCPSTAFLTRKYFPSINFSNFGNAIYSRNQLSSQHLCLLENLLKSRQQGNTNSDANQSHSVDSQQQSPSENNKRLTSFSIEILLSK